MKDTFGNEIIGWEYKLDTPQARRIRAKKEALKDDYFSRRFGPLETEEDAQRWIRGLRILEAELWATLTPAQQLNLERKRRGTVSLPTIAEWERKRDQEKQEQAELHERATAWRTIRRFFGG